ncbi:MAG: HAD family hydrolase [Candidatus Brennerbacteria bacterium]|nr:HAD family hydrolase [Candidatus Brennerbacteria bacterium]
MKTGFIFDLDGTLLDSPSIGKYRVTILLAVNGVFLTEQAKRKLFSQWGKPAIPMLTESLGIPHEMALAINKQWEIWDGIDPASFIKGAREIVEWCRDTCGEVALYTSRHTENVDQLLRQLKARDAFSLVVGREGDAEGRLPRNRYEKENPASFLAIEAYLSHRYRIEQVVYVGDTIFDVGYARAADMESIAVLSGGTPFEEFQNLGVEIKNILASVKEIRGWVVANL